MTSTYSLEFTFHHSSKGKVCSSKTIYVLLFHTYN